MSEATMGDRFDEVRARMDAFLRDWPGAEFGPAHIVLSDDNLEDEWIDDCLALIARGRWPAEYGRDDWPSVAECEATAAFLRSLKDVPEDERCPAHGEEGE